MNQTPVLQADRLTFRYGHGPAAPGIDEVSLRVRAGQRLAIVGESGSGKTTTARLLLGLLRPASGAVLHDGAPLDLGDRRAMRAFRSQVQGVFQDPYSSLDPRMRIGRIVAEPIRALRLASGPAVRDRVEQALHAVGLSPGHIRDYPHELSGGQRQRVAIARAIVCEPRVLIADEPVSALDMSTKVRITALLDRLSRERAMALVLVSHDLATVAATCDDVVVMRAGRVVEAGDLRTVLSSPVQEYTRRFLAAVPRLP